MATILLGKLARFADPAQDYGPIVAVFVDPCGVLQLAVVVNGLPLVFRFVDCEIQP